MKKIEVNVKPGQKGRYPVFTSAEALYMYMAGSAKVSELTSHIHVVELDGIERRRAFIEWAGIEPAPKFPGKSQKWMRIVRGVVETGPISAPRFEPFYGWVHPEHFKMEFWEDNNCIAKRCDDDKTIDIDSVFSESRKTVALFV